MEHLPGKSKQMVILAAFVALGFAVYGQALGHHFLLNWDDYFYVVDNPLIRSISAENLKAIFTRSYFANYAPVHLLSYLADYQLYGGLNAQGFTLTNILLHIGNALLLNGLVGRITGNRLAGALAAGIFLLHPVQVESAAWISQRKNTLAMLFFLGALWAYVEYAAAASRQKGWYTLALCLFVLAVLTKSIAVIFPLVVISYDFCYLQRRNLRDLLLNKLPFLLVALLIALTAIVTQKAAIAEGHEVFHAGGAWQLLCTLPAVFLKYLQNLFWPTSLSAVYLVPIRKALDWQVAAGLLTLVAFAAGGIALFLRNRELFFWYALIVIGLLPVSQIVPLPTLMNDRYLYFPMVGIAVLVAVPLARVLAGATGPGKAGVITACLLAAVGMTLLAWQRVDVWQDDITLWTDVTRKSPDSPQAWQALGDSLREAGRIEEAIGSYRQALAVDPYYRMALNNLGALYNQLGQYDRGRPHLLEVARWFPDYFEGILNLALNYYFSGDYPAAQETLQKALFLQPGSKRAHYFLGMATFRMGQYELAHQSFRNAVMSGGTDPEIEYMLACLASLGNRPGNVFDHLHRALTLGFSDFARIGSDRCFDPLRHDPEFQSIIARFAGH